MQKSLKGLTLQELRGVLAKINVAIRTIELEAEQRSLRNAAPKVDKPAVKSAIVTQSEKSEKEKVVKPQGVPSSDVALPHEDPPIKFMHPVNRNWAWDGKGVEPEWIQAYLERGGSWDALENTAAIFMRRRRGFRYRAN